MPGISWLGTLGPTPQETMAPIAEAVNNGMQAFLQFSKQQQAHKEAGKELAVKEKALKPYADYISMEKKKQENDYAAKLSEIDANKKKELVGIIMDSVKMMDKENSTQFLANSQVQALFKDVGVPVPTGAYGVKEESGVLQGLGRGIEAAGKGLGSWLSKGKTESKVATKEYMGHTYEKQRDNLWHKVK